VNAQPLEALLPDQIEEIPEREVHRRRIEAALRQEQTALQSGRLEELAGRFNLDTLEADILAVLWAAAFDPVLRSKLTEQGAYPDQLTVHCVTRVFNHPPRIHLKSESPLRLWRMVAEHVLPDGSAALTLDPAILAWLEGEDEIDRALAGRIYLLPASPELPSWPLDSVERQVREGLHAGQRWRVQILGPDALAARWFAAAIGRRLGLPVLAVPAGALAGEAEAAVCLHRQAFLSTSVPCIAMEDASLSQPPGVLPYAVQFVHGPELSARQIAEVHDLAVELPAPDAEERVRLWRYLWPQAMAWSPTEFADLVLCHEASLSEIAAAAATSPASPRDAARALRERLRNDLGLLARRSESAFAWNDLVLPEAIHARLQEIAFEARERARVWAEPAAARLFPYGRGLIALFSGPPGTGKTMAAQVIAADLGVDLFTVDLSAVISKWVGETAQHIQQLLSSRTAQRSVLFFDEADALFAKRVEEVRDAQDRFANMDTSHLMTALEAYPGIVILASNLKGNVDTAFLRRIRHVVDFPKPDRAARAQIWHRAVDALFPPAQAEAMAADLLRIARAEATGAQIKNAALSALFAARHAQVAPSAKLLGEMLARELAKEGAGMSLRELDALLESPS
jgi:adenylate kinase family enzyme